MHPSPNIWRSSVIEKKKTEILRVNRRFRKEKSDIYVLYIRNEVYAIMSASRDRGKELKKVIRNFRGEMEFFS